MGFLSSGWCGSVVEYPPANQRVTSSIPGLGHIPGLLTRFPVAGVLEVTTHGVSLLLFPFPPLKHQIKKDLKINK